MESRRRNLREDNEEFNDDRFLMNESNINTFNIQRIFPARRNNWITETPVLLPIPNEMEYKKRREEIEDENCCVVCLDYEKIMTFIPCEHMCCCEYCSVGILATSNKCPICRSQIFEMLKQSPSIPNEDNSKQINSNHLNGEEKEEEQEEIDDSQVNIVSTEVLKTKNNNNEEQEQEEQEQEQEQEQEEQEQEQEHEEEEEEEDIYVEPNEQERFYSRIHPRTIRCKNESNIDNANDNSNDHVIDC